MHTSGQEYAHVGWGDLWKLVGLMGFIVLMLVVGVKAESLAGSMARVVNASMSEQRVEWEWNPTPTKDPWRLREADLNNQRVLMNWMQKPGFRWLVVYALVSVVGVGVVLHMVNRAVDWVVMVLRRVAQVRVDVGNIGAVISGTVRISAASGVIYLSGLPRAVVEGMEEYASVLLGARVVVVEI